MSVFTTPDWPKRAETLEITEEQIQDAANILRQGLESEESLGSCAYAVMRHYQEAIK